MSLIKLINHILEDHSHKCEKVIAVNLFNKEFIDDEKTDPTYTQQELEWLRKNLNLPTEWQPWQPPVCECGASKTPNPNCHSDWCPKSGKRK